MTGGSSFEQRADGKWVQVDTRYEVSIKCSVCAGIVRNFESMTSIAADDGVTPMLWRPLGEGEILDAASPDGLRAPKGVARPRHLEEGRHKLRCVVCKEPPLEIRAEKLNPILDTLSRAGVADMSLSALAARLHSTSAKRRST